MVRVALAAAFALQLVAAGARADASPSPVAQAPVEQQTPVEHVRDVSLTSGLALGVSFPTGAGLIGLRADYLFQLPSSWFRLGVHAAVGAYLCPDPECHPSTTFGLLGSWGHHHRVFLEARTGTLGGVTLYLHGQAVASRAVWGIGSEVGYEYMAASGYFLRFGVGIALLVDAAIEPLSERIGPSLTLLHVGCKLW
jgi:hypothetical protein